MDARAPQPVEVDHSLLPKLEHIQAGAAVSALEHGHLVGSE